MYLWDIRKLAYRLRTNKLSASEIALYCFLSPFLSISSGLFFGVLLFSHQIIEYSFQGWLGQEHSFTEYYDLWSLGMTCLTILISFTGIYLCYRTNKKGDGKEFWKRMACLSFPINFHIIVYSLAIIAISIVILAFALKGKISSFHENVWPAKKAAASVVQNSYISIGFAKKLLAFFKLPMIGTKITALLEDIREIIFLGYPLLSIVPPLLSFSHYLIVRRMIKRVSRKAQINSLSENTHKEL